MKKFYSLLAAVLYTVLAAVGHAQSYPGQAVATQFAQWRVPNFTAGSYIFPSTVCSITAGKQTFAPIFATNAPIKIVDPNPALTETVTPVAVTYNQQQCAINITPANFHSSFVLQSGTCGLQEAINAQQNLPSVIIITPDFASMGCSTSTITSAQGSANVSIFDQRTAVFVPYTWSGSAYVSTGLPATAPNPNLTVPFNQLGFLTGSNMSYNPGLGPLGVFNSPWTKSQRPRIDVTAPQFGIPSGCAAPADPGTAITSVSVNASGVATATANNAYLAGQNVWIEGLTTTNGLLLNTTTTPTAPWTILAVPPPTATQFSFQTALSSFGATTDLGVAMTDSSCPIAAAVTYGKTAYGPTTLGPFPQIYFPAGHYIVKQAFRTPYAFDIGGDGKNPTMIEQTTANANIFTVFRDGSATPNIQGWNEAGAIHDLMLTTNFTGTSGQPFNGHTADFVELQFVPQYSLRHLSFYNSGGRCLVLTSPDEEIRAEDLHFIGCKQAIDGLGQASSVWKDIYIPTTGQLAVTNGGNNPYVFDANASYGYPTNLHWNPTTVSLTSLSIDANGGLQVTVTCTTSPACLQQGYNSSSSSPLPAGNWFSLQGITTAGFTNANGIFQATAVSGAFGSNFTISSCPPGDSSTICTGTVPANAQFGGTWNEATNFGFNYNADGSIWVGCFSTPGCSAALSTGTAGTTTTLTGAWFGPVMWPSANAAIFGGGPATEILDLRIAPTWYAVGLQLAASSGTGIYGLYCEGFAVAGEPHLNPCVQLGGYMPWTYLTSGLNSMTCSTSTPCAAPVTSTNNFPNYINDASVASDFNLNTINMSITCKDYNATQSGVACATQAGVNKDQVEVVSALMAGDGQVHITARCQGGTTVSPCTAGTPATWPVWIANSRIGFTNATAPQSPPNNITTLRDLHVADIIKGGANWFPYTNDNSPMVTSSYLMGPRFDNWMLYPAPQTGQFNAATYALIEASGTSGCAALNPPSLGLNCIKFTSRGTALILNPAGANFAQTGQVPELPSSSNGAFFNSLSVGCLMANYTLQGGTAQQAMGRCVDLGYQSFANSYSSTPGTGTFIQELNNVTNTTGIGPGIGNASIAQGWQYKDAIGWFDMAGFSNQASITSWSRSGATVTIQATNTFVAGQQVFIAGLVAGSFINSNNGQSYTVNSPTGSQFSITLPSSVTLYPYYSTGATEAGTATFYNSGTSWQCAGGPDNTGANAKCGFYQWSGSAWTSYFNIAGGSAAATITTPATTTGIFGGAITFNSTTKAGTIYTAAGTPLPTCNAGAKGTQAVVGDATTPTYLATYTSGGAVVAPVVCNGTNWVTY